MYHLWGVCSFFFWNKRVCCYLPVLPDKWGYIWYFITAARGWMDFIAGHDNLLEWVVVFMFSVFLLCCNGNLLWSFKWLGIYVQTATPFSETKKNKKKEDSVNPRSTVHFSLSCLFKAILILQRGSCGVILSIVFWLPQWVAGDLCLKNSLFHQVRFRLDYVKIWHDVMSGVMITLLNNMIIII